MNKQEMTKRYITLLVGLFLISMGIALTKHAELGVSPVSSVGNVLSIRFDCLTLGGWLTVTNCLMILCQIVLLRKNFSPIQFLQFPVSVLSGYFTDICLYMISPIGTDAYFTRLILLIAGVVVLAMGISVTVIANTIVNPAEGIVKAIAIVSNKGFGDIKTAFDVSWVALAVVISLILFDFELMGVREGTIIAAFMTGYAVKFWNKRLTPPLKSFFAKKVAK
jgi:uncharacterized membrane protein YczE